MSWTEARLLLQKSVVVIGLLLLERTGEEVHHGGLVANMLSSFVANTSMSMEQVIH